jgi:hypothetical protein
VPDRSAATGNGDDAKEEHNRRAQPRVDRQADETEQARHEHDRERGERDHDDTDEDDREDDAQDQAATRPRRPLPSPTSL